MISRFMGKKNIIKVCEWITVVGNGSWPVPEGCKSIDFCVIAGGANGGSASDNGGNGGNGGGSKNVYKLSVSSGTTISFTVGAANGNSMFGNTIATTGSGPRGGAGALSVGDGGDGGDGSTGIYPFDNNKLFKRFCRGGGGGARSRREGHTNEGVYNDKYGGTPNGGNASSYTWYDAGWNAHYGQSANPGGGGAYYGAGGGGGGFGSTSMFGDKAKGPGGAGYQGCIILIYERRKKSTDVIDSSGYVKINWPANA